MDGYPFKAPKITFHTKIYHPNVSSDGKICTLAIEKDWVPTRSAIFVIDAVLSTFRNPSDQDPQDTAIASEFKNNYSKWAATAQEWTQKYAV